jgi:hypothetical protein
MNNVLGHGLIDYLFVFFMIGYAYYAGITKPHRILYILPACLSCFFFLPFGSNLTADKLVPIIFIISVILSKGTNYFSVENGNNKWISKIWLIITFSSVVGVVYTNYYANFIKSPLINSRLVIQIISYINAVLIYIIVRKEITKTGGVNLLLKSFLITTSILCCYGIYQYFAHQYGLPYRGIVYSEYKTGFGGFHDSDDVIFRVNSLANEPKRLTYFLVLSLIILFKFRKKITGRLNFLWYAITVLIHIIVLWLTYSTSIYFSITIFIILLFLYTLFVKFNKILFRQLSFILIGGVGLYFYQSSYFDKIYKTRVDKQLEHEEVRAEIYGQKFITSYPEMLILGFGPGVYNFALAKEYPNKAGIVNKGKMLRPFNSGVMTYLFDFGVIGLFLIFYPFIQILFNTRISIKNEYSIFVIFLFCTAVTLLPTPTLFFFLGAFDGYKKFIK